MDDKIRAKYEAAGIRVRSLTQEECDRIPVSMYSGGTSAESNKSTTAPGTRQQRKQSIEGYTAEHLELMQDEQEAWEEKAGPVIDEILAQAEKENPDQQLHEKYLRDMKDLGLSL